MSLPALAAVAGLAAVAHLGRKGSAADVSQENKKKIIDLIKGWRISEARALALELGLDRLDLSYADLSGADLRYAGLAGADLSNANLAGANLSYARLTNANLTDANLSNANLAGADLSRALLTDANLADANLRGALITDTTGINIGPSRTFIGIPRRHIEVKSPFAPGRTTLRRTQ